MSETRCPIELLVLLLTKDLRDLSLVLLSFIFPSTMMAMNQLCLNRCPISFIFHFIIAYIVVFLSLTSSGTVSFGLYSIHLVPIILLHSCISITSILFCSYPTVFVHVSQPYNSKLQMYIFKKLFFEAILERLREKVSFLSRKFVLLVQLVFLFLL